MLSEKRWLPSHPHHLCGSSPRHTHTHNMHFLSLSFGQRAFSPPPSLSESFIYSSIYNKQVGKRLFAAHISRSTKEPLESMSLVFSRVCLCFGNNCMVVVWLRWDVFLSSPSVLKTDVMIPPGNICVVPWGQAELRVVAASSWMTHFGNFFIRSYEKSVQPVPQQVPAERQTHTFTFSHTADQLTPHRPQLATPADITCQLLTHTLYRFIVYSLICLDWMGVLQTGWVKSVDPCGSCIPSMLYNNTNRCTWRLTSLHGPTVDESVSSERPGQRTERTSLMGSSCSPRKVTEWSSELRHRNQ